MRPSILYLTMVVLILACSVGLVGLTTDPMAHDRMPAWTLASQLWSMSAITVVSSVIVARSALVNNAKRAHPWLLISSGLRLFAMLATFSYLLLNKDFTSPLLTWVGYSPLPVGILFDIGVTLHFWSLRR